VHIYVVYYILMIRRRQNDDHRAYGDDADEAYEREKGVKGERGVYNIFRPLFRPPSLSFKGTVYSASMYCISSAAATTTTRVR